MGKSSSIFSIDEFVKWYKRSSDSAHGRASLSRVQSAFLKHNSNKFKVEYFRYVEKRYFSISLRSIFILVTILCAALSSKKLGNFLPYLIYSPSVVVLATYPYLANKIPTKKYLWLANSIAPIYIFQMITSFAVYYIQNKLDLLSPGLPTVFMIFLGSMSFFPDRLHSFIWSCLCSIFFLTAIFLISHDTVLLNSVALLVGFAIGIALGLILDDSIRQSFYGEEIRQVDKGIMECSPLGIVFVILGKNSELVVDYTRSVYTQNIFGVFPDGTLKFSDYILKSLQMNDYSKSDLYSTIFTMLGESTFTFDLNQKKLPKSGSNILDGQERQLEFIWNYITNSDGIVVKIQMTIMDVTEKRILETDLAVAKDRNVRLNQLINCTKPVALTFVPTFFSILEKAKFETAYGDAESLVRFKLYVHSLKGAARSLNFENLLSLIHNLESYMLDHHSQPIHDLMLNARKQLIAIHDSMVVYKSVMNDQLGWTSEREDFGELSKQALIEIFPLGGQLSNDVLSGKIVDSGIRRAFEITYPRLSTVFRNSIFNIEKISNELHKLEPKVTISGCDPHLSHELVEALQSIFPQLISNSIDHGIESPEIRTMSGKAVEGGIHLFCQFDEGMLCLTWSDDGAGMDINNIERDRASNPPKGELQTQVEELAQLVFKHEFTTKKTVSNISGRGVGLTTVKATAEGLGGVAEVVLGTRLPNGNYNFKIKVCIPRFLALEPVVAKPKLHLSA
ncbi:MAG: hypothetical protein EOP48_00470 [Sphingobacteriales bacterium]|nr:MAG: hypothetical protein EOP48_00470 [Sphingobacteriales bacterium]